MIVCALLVSNSRECCLAAPGDLLSDERVDIWQQQAHSSIEQMLTYLYVSACKLLKYFGLLWVLA